MLTALTAASVVGCLLYLAARILMAVLVLDPRISRALIAGFFALCALVVVLDYLLEVSP